MDANFKTRFEELYTKYFPNAELPLTFYYSDTPPADVEVVAPAKGWRCFIASLGGVRLGKSLAIDEQALGCGKRFCGFQVPLRANFEYFLSCGIPGELEGERYKSSPELVKQLMKNWPQWQAPARYLILKRWDKLTVQDRPEVAFFYATPDVLSGLFTLANYEEADPSGGVLTPFSAGCGTIIQYPYLENQQEHPRCVLGMFDVSARPCVKASELTFAVPMKRFERMIANWEDSFLITKSWTKVMKRMAPDNPGHE